MLQRHLDAHVAIPPHGIIARSPRRVWVYWGRVNGECAPVGRTKISALVWKLNIVLL